MKGQLSAEMIILVAVVLAVVAIVAFSLTESAKKGNEAVENRTDEILRDSERAANAAAPEVQTEGNALAAIPC